MTNGMILAILAFVAFIGSIYYIVRSIEKYTDAMMEKKWNLNATKR